MINIKDLKYKVVAYLSNGSELDLTDLLSDLSIEDNEGELAQRVTMSMANTVVNGSYLNSLMSLCTVIFVYCNDIELFRGSIWDVDYESSMSRTIDLICYDKLIYSKNSKDNLFFTKGKTTESVVSSICRKWGINLSYAWGSHSHEKLVYRNQYVADSIIDTLKEAAKKIGKTWCASMEQDVLHIRYKGYNKDVYVFSAEENTVVGTRSRQTLDNLVTKVIIVGKEPKTDEGEVIGSPPITETLLGKTEYGDLQEIVSYTESEDLADAKKEAREILDERGKPEESLSIEGASVPFIKKGHKIYVAAGNLVGYFYIKSISHNMKSRIMKAELERV